MKKSKINSIFAVFKPRTKAVIGVAIILASVVLKTYGIGYQNSTFCHAEKPQNVLGGTEQGSLVSGINLKLLQMPRTATESQAQTLNAQPESLPVEVIRSLPQNLILNIIKLDEIRKSIEDFQENVCDFHKSTKEQISIVFKCLMDANDALCNVVGEDIKTLFYDTENTRFLYRKECV
jgi:hypothetical protein